MAHVVRDLSHVDVVLRVKRYPVRRGELTDAPVIVRPADSSKPLAAGIVPRPGNQAAYVALLRRQLL